MALKSISNNPFCSIYSTPSTCYEDGIPFPCFQTVDLCSKLASGGIVSSTAKEDYASCKNSKKIMGYGDKNSFSGVWAAYNYTTEGTSKGDWCIPAAGIFTSIENNLNIINTGFSHVGGTQFTSYTKIWASTATENGEIFYSDFTQSYALNTSSSTAFKDFRPVIEF